MQELLTWCPSASFFNLSFNAALVESKETLLEGHVQGANGLLLVPLLLQHVDCLPVGQPIARGGFAVVLSVNAAQLLHLFDDLDGVFLYERFVGKDVLLPGEAVEVRRREDMRESSETMEQHGNELDHDDQEEKEDEHDSDGLQVQILLRDDDLENKG